MPPKEKAKQLIRKFETSIAEETLDSDKIIKYSAKQCSLIAVDEIIKTLEEMPDNNNIAFYRKERVRTTMDIELEYWQEVKTEINNL